MLAIVSVYMRILAMNSSEACKRGRREGSVIFFVFLYSSLKNLIYFDKLFYDEL